MNNRERVIAALNFERPDSVPYSIGFTQQMYDKMLAYPGGPECLRSMNNHITEVDLCKPFDEVKPEYFRDEFGVVWNRSGVDKDIGVVDFWQLKEPEDLEGFALPPVDEAFIRGRVEALLKQDPENFRMVNLGFSLFERAWTLRGMENLLCDMLIEPEFVHALLDRITARLLKILDIALEYDIDGVHFGDDWGQQRGLIMGPDCWRTFIKPRLAKLYGRVRAAGRYVVQHSCGDIRLVMNDLYEIGLNMYQTFQPEIYGYDYAREIDGRIAIWGGISTQRDLPCKTPDEIRAVVDELLAAFPHGGLVAAPTHSVPGDVPPANILAMVQRLDPDVLA